MTLTIDKKVVLSSFIFVLSVVAVMGIMLEDTVGVNKYGIGKDGFSGDQPTQYTQISEASSGSGLKAMIKGSIYETGSNMTVYGACFDGDGYLLPDAAATFTAWYPNGTIVTGPNATMDMIYYDAFGYHLNGTGRWKIHVTMSDTIGTYLTEIRCDYDGQWAVAFGEWQNPEWVKKIGDTYLSSLNMSSMVNNISSMVQSMSSTLNEFKNDTNNNFSTVISTINNIQSAIISGTATPAMIDELSRLIHSVDMNIWTIDPKDPFFVLGSGTNNFHAIDALNPNSVHAVGYEVAVYWDGETWTYRNMTGTDLYGVSVLPSNYPYAWYVGTNLSNSLPIISVNGATPYQPTLPGDTSTGLNDVRLFQRPNDPSGAFYGYLFANDGRVYYSSDSGSTWSYLVTLDPGTGGRLSEVVDNYGNGVPVDGYAIMAGQGSKVSVWDGSSLLNYSVNGNVTGVSLLYGDLGYVVSEGTDSLAHIYKWNGTSLTETYTINDTGIVPKGIDAVASNDVWLVTESPSTFYHFDGTKWEYATVPSGSFVSVMISFGNTTFTSGISDISMINGKAGYAVGSDGLIMIYQSHYDNRIDELLSNLTAQLGSLNLNLTPITNYLDAMNLTIEDIRTNTSLAIYMLQQLNQSISNISVTAVVNLTEVNVALAQMNTTINTIDGRTYNMSLLLNAMNLSISDMNSVMMGNFTIINNKLDTLDINLTDIRTVVNYINTTLLDFKAEAIADLIEINQTTQNTNVVVNQINTTVNNMYTAVSNMNLSMMAEFSALNIKLDAMNSSLQFKLDNVLNNVTYSQLYMESTLFPMLNATYENTLAILAYLGIIDSKLNVTIELQNATLQIVNQTQQDIDILINKSNRIRAWITQ